VSSSEEDVVSSEDESDELSSDDERAMKANGHDGFRLAGSDFKLRTCDSNCRKVAE
jgi:hypothetical protein